MNTGVEDGVSVKGSHRNLRKIVRTDANGNVTILCERIVALKHRITARSLLLYKMWASDVSPGKSREK